MTPTFLVPDIVIFMSVPESILIKIKLLIKLGTSPNTNEAENAKAMAEKLIAKYELTEEELKSLEDKKPLYGEDEKVFSTIGLEGWRQQLVLAIAKHFFCQIIQEETVPVEGLHEFAYFAYGDPDEVKNVKFVYNSFSKSVEELMRTYCVGRGPIYIASYGEGAVEAIKSNIALDGIDLPKIKKTELKEEEKVLNNGTSNLTPHKEPKEKPAEQSVDVNSQSLIKDIRAYFKGIEDGRDLSLQSALRLKEYNEEAWRIQEATEETSEHSAQQGSDQTSQGREDC